MEKLVPIESIVRKIVWMREEKVLIDRDIAELYGVETSALNRAVKRNIDRFPEDFMFQLDKKEAQRLRCQNGISKPGRGGRRYLPYAFTEQGVAMPSSVLRSKRAVEVNIAIMRAFVHLRNMAASHDELSAKLKELEQHLESHDKQIQTIFEVIKQLMTSPLEDKKKIGFTVREPQATYGDI